MNLADELSRFFDEYNETFVDGERIAALYHTPTVTMRADGSVHCLQSREQLARFFQGVAETYRSCRSVAEALSPRWTGSSYAATAV